MFEPFITETNPDDKWTFDLENLVQIEQVNKKLNTTKRRFSKTFTVLTAFRCAVTNETKMIVDCSIVSKCNYYKILIFLDVHQYLGEHYW